MNNKKGFSYIMVSVLVLIVSMFISIGLYYASIFYLVRQEREHTSITMDQLVTKYAVSSYDSLKQGVDYVSSLDKRVMVNRAYYELGFSSSNVQKISKRQGETVYRVSRPSITATTGETFGVNVSYSIDVPFELFGHQFSVISVPVNVESRFTFK